MMGFNLTSVKVQGEGNQIKTFFYMSHAKYFVPSTGGFSKLIAGMVEQLGGKVLEFPIPSYYGEESNNTINVSDWVTTMNASSANNSIW